MPRNTKTYVEERLEKLEGKVNDIMDGLPNFIRKIANEVYEQRERDELDQKLLMDIEKVLSIIHRDKDTSGHKKEGSSFDLLQKLKIKKAYDERRAQDAAEGRERGGELAELMLDIGGCLRGCL